MSADYVTKRPRFHGYHAGAWKTALIFMIFVGGFWLDFGGVEGGVCVSYQSRGVVDYSKRLGQRDLVANC